MALFPEWLLRSIRRDSIDSPVLAIERLVSLPQPIPEEDKEILVGAVLTMSASLTLALGMLQELLPQEQSRERVGEVLCPTLGQLLASLEKTLPALSRDVSSGFTGTPVTAAVQPDASNAAPARVPGAREDHPAPKNCQQTTSRDHQPAPAHPSPVTRPRGPSSRPVSPQQEQTQPESFPAFEDSSAAGHSSIAIDRHDRPDTQLITALRAEMRVQAAIHVAIESLEFAEGQLKVMKVGGDIDLLQKHFYEGYNRLLLRALELQRQELGSPPGRDDLASAVPVQRQANGLHTVKNTPKQHHSVSFETAAPIPPLGSVARGNSVVSAGGPRRWPPPRRNTIQGIRQENHKTAAIRPALKRRLSLAEELAMVGEDTESGNQYETSEAEMASSTSELEDSDVEPHGDIRGIVRTRELYTGRRIESASEEDTSDSEGSEDRTLNVSHAVVTGVSCLQSRPPRQAAQR